MKPHEFNSRDLREEGPSLPDDFIRKVLRFPQRGEHAKRNAAYSAQLLEADRKPTAADVSLAYQDFLDAIEEQTRATDQVNVMHARYLRLRREAGES